MTSALVVGLLPAQAERVRRAVGNRFKLRFVPSEEAAHIKRTRAVNVICLDYTDHKTEWRLVNLLQPGQTLFKVRGLDKSVIAKLGACP